MCVHVHYTAIHTANRTHSSLFTIHCSLFTVLCVLIYVYFIYFFSSIYSVALCVNIDSPLILFFFCQQSFILKWNRIPNTEHRTHQIFLVALMLLTIFWLSTIYPLGITFGIRLAIISWIPLIWISTNEDKLCLAYKLAVHCSPFWSIFSLTDLLINYHYYSSNSRCFHPMDLSYKSSEVVFKYPNEIRSPRPNERSQKAERDRFPSQIQNRISNIESHLSDRKFIQNRKTKVGT